MQFRKFEPSTSVSMKEGLVCDQQERNCKFTCKLFCCQCCSFCQRVSTKERCKSQLSLSLSMNKVCERCCSRSTCRGQIAPVLGEVVSPRGQSQSGNSTQGRLHPPLPVLAKFDQVTNCHKLLYKPPQESLLAGGIASAFEQKCSGTGSNSKIPGVL